VYVRTTGVSETVNTAPDGAFWLPVSVTSVVNSTVDHCPGPIGMVSDRVTSDTVRSGEPGAGVAAGPVTVKTEPPDPRPEGGRVTTRGGPEGSVMVTKLGFVLPTPADDGSPSVTVSTPDWPARGAVGPPVAGIVTTMDEPEPSGIVMTLGDTMPLVPVGATPGVIVTAPERDPGAPLEGPLRGTVVTNGDPDSGVIVRTVEPATMPGSLPAPPP